MHINFRLVWIGFIVIALSDIIGVEPSAGKFCFAHQEICEPGRNKREGEMNSLITCMETTVQIYQWFEPEDNKNTMF